MTPGDLIYLDYNATAPIRPEVITLVSEIMTSVGNASSVHKAGRGARARIDTARHHVAQLVGTQAKNVIFTSGGTEADNLALRGFGPRQLIVSAVEHGAILAPALLLDPNALVLPVDDQGCLNLDSLEKALGENQGPFLVSIMLANNETGVIQPIKEIAKIAHQYEALVHCDGIQAVGKIPVDIEELKVDMLSISAHKIGGLQGVGALVLREDRLVSAQIVGGGQEMGRRSGTENVAGIAAFGEAARLVGEELNDYRKLSDLRDSMEVQLSKTAPSCNVFGSDAIRIPNTSCITMPGVRSDTQIMALDLAGFAISAGSACSSGKVAPSHVLDAMGVENDIAMTAIRISLGCHTASKDITSFITAWSNIYHKNNTHNRNL